MTSLYSIDTSGLLDGMKRHYPPATFTGMWERIEELVTADRLMVCEMVKAELQKRDDDAHDWIKNRPEMVKPLDDERQRIVREVLGRYPRLVDTKKGRSGADPFVIALALHFQCPVITGERLTGNMNSPRIPDVCLAMGVPYMTFLEFIQEEGWTFR